MGTQGLSAVLCGRKLENKFYKQMSVLVDNGGSGNSEQLMGLKPGWRGEEGLANIRSAH